jgi:hypothetical protein
MFIYSQVFLLIAILLTFSLHAKVKDGALSEREDYSKFYGRITDRNQRGDILKIHTENSNIKLFQAGDVTRFYLASKLDQDPCIAYVRDVENNYLVVSVNNIDQCWNLFGGIRRGAILKFDSEILAKRVIDASVFREVLIKRKNDYLSQLRSVNEFLVNFKQNKVKEIANLEQAIVQLEENKLKKINELNIKRKDYIHLQRELNFRLDKLDEDIEVYRLERVELLRDRWAQDLDLGKPMGTRPQDIKNWPVHERRFEFDD